MGKHKRSWSSGAVRVNRSIRVDDAPCGSIIRIELCHTVRLPNGTVLGKSNSQVQAWIETLPRG